MWCIIRLPAARLINIVAIEGNPEPVEGWAAPGDRQLLLAQYAKAAAPLRALLAEPAEWLRWSLFDRPAGRITQGRVALLGDAAHPVLPFLAQGAALAIEDAATLASLLSADPANVPTALKTYAQHRQGRVARVQNEARRNGKIYHASAVMALGRNLVMRQLGAERMTSRYDWLYGFKVSGLSARSRALLRASGMTGLLSIGILLICPPPACASSLSPITV